MPRVHKIFLVQKTQGTLTKYKGIWAIYIKVEKKIAEDIRRILGKTSRNRMTLNFPFFFPNISRIQVTAQPLCEHTLT